MEESLYDVRENLMLQLGMEKLPLEKRMALLDVMAELAEKRLMVRLLDEAGEADAAFANALVKQGERAKAIALLARKVPNFMRLMQAEVEKVRSESLLASQDDTFAD